VSKKRVDDVVHGQPLGGRLTLCAADRSRIHKPNPTLTDRRPTARTDSIRVFATNSICSSRNSGYMGRRGIAGTPFRPGMNRAQGPGNPYAFCSESARGNAPRAHALGGHQFEHRVAVMDPLGVNVIGVQLSAALRLFTSGWPPCNWS
jgi:hypothetical protein